MAGKQLVSKNLQAINAIQVPGMSPELRERLLAIAKNEGLEKQQAFKQILRTLASDSSLTTDARSAAIQQLGASLGTAGLDTNVVKDQIQKAIGSITPQLQTANPVSYDPSYVQRSAQLNPNASLMDRLMGQMTGKLPNYYLDAVRRATGQRAQEPFQFSQTIPGAPPGTRYGEAPTTQAGPTPYGGSQREPNPPWMAPSQQYLPPGSQSDLAQAMPYWPGPDVLEFNPQQIAAMDAMWGQGGSLLDLARQLQAYAQGLPSPQSVMQDLAPLRDMANRLPGMADQAATDIRSGMNTMSTQNQQALSRLNELVRSADLPGIANAQVNRLSDIGGELQQTGRTGYDELRNLAQQIMPRIEGYLGQLQGSAGGLQDLSRLPIPQALESMGELRGSAQNLRDIGQGLIPQALQSMGELRGIAGQIQPIAQQYAAQLRGLAEPLMPAAAGAASRIATEADSLNPMAAFSALQTQDALDRLNQGIQQSMSFVDVANNPYVSNYAQSVADQVTRQAMKQIPGITSAAIESGAYGGPRAAFQQQGVMNQANQVIADQLAQIYNSAYGQGLGMFGQGLSLMPTAATLASRPGDIMNQAAMQTAGLYGQIPGLLQGAAGMAGNLYQGAEGMESGGLMNMANILSQLPGIYGNAVGQTGNLEMGAANILGQLPGIYQNAIGQSGNLQQAAAQILSQLPGIYGQGMGMTGDMQTQAANLLAALQGQAAGIYGQIPGMMQGAYQAQAGLEGMPAELANQYAQIYGNLAGMIPNIYGQAGMQAGQLYGMPYNIMNQIAGMYGNLGAQSGALGTQGTQLLSGVGDAYKNLENQKLQGKIDRWNYNNMLNPEALQKYGDFFAKVPGAQFGNQFASGQTKGTSLVGQYGGNLGLGIGGGALQGAGTGAAFGPWGALIGGVAGAGLGALGAS